MIRKCAKGTSVSPIQTRFWGVYICASPLLFLDLINQHIQTILLQKK